MYALQCVLKLKNPYKIRTSKFNLRAAKFQKFPGGHASMPACYASWLCFAQHLTKCNIQPIICKSVIIWPDQIKVASYAPAFPDRMEKPIAYASRKLSQAEKNYEQIQKEALAIIYGVKKFRQYLIGCKFCLITDHKPLLSIFNPAKGIPEMIASRLQRWAITLSSYNYEVKYQASNKHGNADALSRLPLDTDEGSNDEVTDTVCLLEQQQLSDLLIKAADIQQ